MTVAQLIEALGQLPQEAPVALRSILPDQRVRWDDIEQVQVRGRDYDMPPVVLIR